ncbi:MAG TPA: TRC40/GET3/ArsA family transport-energizing ATPase, partial [Acidimicrobiales bacterium]|nr:TRC40/GET3/ArsA family transport-energizing ATPase [Acidimicrobiales bacterium]
MSTRVLLFTGKGGVGKTSVAAATALRCADAGLRTLVLSTDPAHSLADAFDYPLDSTERQIDGSLYGQQLDATERLEESWGDIQHYLTEVLHWAGVDGIEAEELAVIPGLDEIFSLSDLKAYADSGAWEVIVVDCGPTAETIRLLSLPQVLGWYMDRVFPAGRRVTKLMRPVLNRVTNLPIADDSVFESARRFYDRLDGVRELLADGETTSVRLVVNPEKLVIAEARRTATYLGLFGYRVDAVIANRLLPDAVTDPWFKAWKEAHAEHLSAIEEGFAPVPVLRAELAPEELIGVERLREFAEALYGDVDPSA